MPTHVTSAYHKEGPGDGSLPFPWKPTTMLSLNPDIREAKKIVLKPPVKCLHRLTGDRRPRQPKGPCNLATDYYLVPEFESLEDREHQIIRYSLKKAGFRPISNSGNKSTAHTDICCSNFHHEAEAGTEKAAKKKMEKETEETDEGNEDEKEEKEEEEQELEESWSNDGVSVDRGTKKKRFQWQPRITPSLIGKQPGKAGKARGGGAEEGLILGGLAPGQEEAELRAVPSAPPRKHHRARPVHVVMTGGVDPRFRPTVGDLVLVPPKRQLPGFRIPDGACIMTVRDCDSTFKYQPGDLVMCLGRYVQALPAKENSRRRTKLTCPVDPPILYDPFASVSLYRYSEDRRWVLVGCHQNDDLHWVPSTRDYLYSAGQDLEIGGKCPYGTVQPKLGDIIIRPGAWDEKFDHRRNYRRSLVKWWTPRLQFRYGIVPGTVLVRPFIDGMRRAWAPVEGPNFFWGRAEMFVYRGEHAKDGWIYWGSDHHDCSMAPFQPPADVLHYVEDTDVDTGGPENEFRYRHELEEIWGKPGTFVDVQMSGYPL